MYKGWSVYIIISLNSAIMIFIPTQYSETIIMSLVVRPFCQLLYQHRSKLTHAYYETEAHQPSCKCRELPASRVTTIGHCRWYQV